MARRFCNPYGLPRHGYSRIVKFDGFYCEVHRTVVDSSQGCGVSFGAACWHAGMRISEKKSNPSE
jgi:hypothetical protein